MNTPDLIWADDSYAAHRLEYAMAGSKSATLRLQGIKAQVEADPPTQIDLYQRFPYPGHRTCAEWIGVCPASARCPTSTDAGSHTSTLAT